MQRIEVHQEFALPVERVFAYLSQHENLAAVFGAKVERVRDGDTSPNGVGSVRRLKVGPTPPFEETVTQYVPNELVEYRITKGGVLRNHLGTMRFSRKGSGSALDYVIEFGAVVPGLDRIVKVGLERSMRRGLATVDAKA